MNILFISRTYPPVIGGIEKRNFEVGTALAAITRTDIIANTRGKWLLPLFLPYALIRALLRIRRYDAVLLGDGVLGILGYLLKLATATPVACIVHGLDLTYNRAVYQKLWVNIFLKRLDKLVAVGNETIRQGVLRGIPESKFAFIPNGVAITDINPDYSRRDLEAFLGKSLHGPVLLTLGRLVKRKGVAWFIENVASQLDPAITYIVAGEGREESCILAAIEDNKLQDRVIYAGSVSDREKQLLYCTADVFIQPNIKVPGDIEGFGLVVLEAASHGLVVIASRLEGLQDAIIEGRNGLLVEPGDAGAYKSAIETILASPEEKAALGQAARDYVTNTFSWHLIARRYLDILTSLVPRHNN
jgi:phosphatidylinositol alpha-1,6-mannosyltransferase